MIKTAIHEAVGFANAILAKRVLVLCSTKDACLPWCRAIRAETLMRWPYTVYPILQVHHGVHPTAQWIVTSYQIAREPTILRALERLRFDLVIFDRDQHGHQVLSSSPAGRPFAMLGERWVEIAPPRARLIVGPYEADPPGPVFKHEEDEEGEV